MTNQTNRFAALVSMAAVRGALIVVALGAYTDRAVAQTTAAQLTTPTSSIEVGPGATTQGSYKAGEYNGLQNKGLFGLGNVDLRGGASFNSDSALRWTVKGRDLGLDSRSVYAEIGSQGRFRFNFGFDQLRRNRSDSYQTPYIGAGTDTLTLPGAWLVPTVAGSSGSNNVTNVLSARGLVKSIGGAPYIDTRTTSSTMGGLLTPTAAQIAQVNAAADADIPPFGTFNVYTTRRAFDVGVAYNFDPKWAFDAKFRPEHKEGTKPMGTVSRNTGGDISTVIPDVIDANHNQFNSSLSFTGTKSFAQVGYYGSFFKNNVPFMAWQNWATGPAGTGTLNTMSSAPGNTFNQVNATAGFKIFRTAKLVASGSYGRNTQNDAFLKDASTAVVPVGSLNGLVVNTAFNATFTSRPAKKVNLTAAYKYDNRDNRTAVNIFQYADAGETATPNASFPAGSGNPLGAVLAQNANANRPYGRRANRVNVDADLGVATHQWIKGGYEFDRINRACNGSWISCADAALTNEHTLRAEWRANVSEDLDARLDYAYSARRAPDYNENAFLALVPYANVSPASATGSETALSFMQKNGWTGWGPASGYSPTTGNLNVFFPSNNALANTMYANLNRISELVGLRRYYVADRNRNRLRSLLTWQANDRLSFQGGLDLNKDHYPDSTYGLQDAKNWALDIEGVYALADTVSAVVFYTYENQHSLSAGNGYTANSNTSSLTNGQPGAVGLSGNSCDAFTTLQQRNNNNKLDPCLDWSGEMLDAVNTAGVGLTKKASKLDVTANVVFTRARGDNTVTSGNWANNILNGPGGAPTTIAAYFIPATALPTVTSDTSELRLSGRYAVSQRQLVRLAYAYLHMTSADWVYEGMQFGSLSGVLPSNEQAFNYTVHTFGVAYIFTF